MASPQSSRLPSHCWLITGGCGFIGCNLIRRLLAEGVNYIRILDNLSVGSRSDLSRVCTFVEITPDDCGNTKSSSLLTTHASLVELMMGDIRDPDVCLRAAHGTEIIVHLAANTGVAPSVENPRMDMETNVMGTLNMLEAARQNSVKRFIFASSGAPIGECEPPIHEELAPRPVSPYGASKLAGEGYCSAYYRTFGIETVSLRFGNVYGPLSSHKSSIVAKFVRQALAGEVCEIYGDGEQTRDFIYIEDLVEAIMRASIKPVAGEIFQIATNKEHTVNEVAELLKTTLNERVRTDMLITYGSKRSGDVRRNYSNTAKANRLLDWTARTELKYGLIQTIDWFLSSSAVNGRIKPVWSH